MFRKKEKPTQPAERIAIKLPLDFKIVNDDESISSATYMANKGQLWVTLRNEDRYPDHVEFILVYA